MYRISLYKSILFILSLLFMFLFLSNKIIKDREEYKIVVVGKALPVDNLCQLAYI